MKKQLTSSGNILAGLVLLFGIALSGCSEGGSVASGSTNTQTDAPPAGKLLSWSPPTAYQDNSPLDPAHDLAGYNIYIKNASDPFTDADAESAFAAPSESALDLIPVCRLQGLPPGTYQVSVRAVARNGLMSDFSPSASFTL